MGNIVFKVLLLIIILISLFYINDAVNGKNIQIIAIIVRYACCFYQYQYYFQNLNINKL